MNRLAWVAALALVWGCTEGIDPIPEKCPKEQCTICGDGQIISAEGCDDANTDDGDGCSSLCGVEAGWTCSAEAPSLCDAICGDGLRVGGEACDDGNLFNGDGCSERCRPEPRYTCEGQGTGSCDLCGNGEKKTAEQCDDGNAASGDGCSTQCRIEAGWACADVEPSTCSTVCGDGLVVAAEACDDDNEDNGDGCSDRCEVERGWLCTGVGSGFCSPECGDGLLRGAEACDDDNNISGDGCSGLCEVEERWQCNMAEPSSCTGVCGDGFIRGDETCDDRNLMDGDGCSATCTIERGYECDLEPSDCRVDCGDGIRLGNEACDDGNDEQDDGCDRSCSEEIGWDCPGDEPSICSPICGDGLLLGPEGCDDSDTINGDGCNSSCEVEVACGCVNQPSECQCYLYPIESLSAGGQHGCATLTDGTASCWGANESGQLGTGDTMASLRPAAVTGLSNTASLAVGLGRRHSCTRHGSGARCWGANLQGELGDPSRGAQGLTQAPVINLTQVTALGLGTQHSCAAVATGSVRCWGANGSGQLGDGTLTARPSPIRVVGIDAAQAVVAGAAHSCAVVVDGSVRCWGANESGQLGDGTTVDRLTAELSVIGTNRAEWVAAGARSTCAVVFGGTVRCWGANESGQVGDGTFLQRSLPQRVREVEGGAQVVVGDRHACALTTGATGSNVSCWGANDRGQLGDGTVSPRPLADLVPGLTNLTPVSITAGPEHTCVVLDDRTARCWGANEAGQIGNGATDDVLAPAPVLRP